MFAKIWNWLFHACKHEWEGFKEVAVLKKDSSLESLPICTIMVLRCKRCGTLKNHMIKHTVWE